MYLNVGCGNTRYKDVVNVDIYSAPGVTDVDVVADIRSLPYEAESVEGIIANHVLEHLEDTQHIFAIREWYRVLVPGGRLLISVPDLEAVCRAFVDNYKGRRSYYYNCIYGRVLYSSDRHLSGFTKNKLTDLLFSNGFKSLKWSEYDVNLQVVATKGDVPLGRLGHSCGLEDIVYGKLGVQRA